MNRRLVSGAMFLAASLATSAPVLAGWSFSGPPSPPSAFIQTGNMTLELQCDRIRGAQAGPGGAAPAPGTRA